MTSTQSAPSLMRMAAPLIVSFWMRAAVTFVDMIYGALLGDAAVAAIGLAVPFEFLMIALWVGLSTGLTSGLSRAMGAGQGRRIDQYVKASWTLVSILGPVFTLVGAAIWILAPRSGLEPEVGRAFQIYGTVLIGGSAFTSFWSIIPDSLVKAHQDTRTTMWAGIISNLLNVSLNTLFLFVFEWGILGIALSTVLSRIGGLAYALVRAAGHERMRRLGPEATNPTLDPKPYRAILGLAIPSSLTFALMALESGIVNALLARLEYATEAIAAYAIYYRILLFAMQPVIAVAVALLPYAAKRFGAGDYAGVRTGLRAAVAATAVYSVALLGPLMGWISPWIALQLAETEITARFTTGALYTVPLGCLTGALFLLCRPVFEAMNQGRPGLILALLRYGILTIPLAWAGLRLAQRYEFPEIYGLIAGMLVVSAISSVAFMAWLRSSLRRKSARAL